MILIEALNIRSGGGINLLLYLALNLNNQNIPFKILINKHVNIIQIPKSNLIIASNSSFLNRKKNYISAVNELRPKSILTFNFPPPLTFRNTFVITDFQNMHLTSGYDSQFFSLKSKLMWYLKKRYLLYNYTNSSLYTMPTAFIQTAFSETYSDRVPSRILSYYDERSLDESYKTFRDLGIVKDKNSFIYVSSPYYHKNHFRLLEAWEMLLQKGLTPELKLTLPTDSELSVKHLHKVKQLNKQGARIVNLNEEGHLKYQDILRHTYLSKFTIYPSLNETFGFGLVEGAKMGNNILVSDKPYSREIVKPSLVFDPHDSKSIAACVERALSEDLIESILLFKDNSSQLIELLKQD